MRIGIFDSGLGGLVIAKSVFKKLPAYDYLYLGDTKHVPYGNRGQAEILKFTKQALNYLFEQDCKLVIIACNTSSAEALRKIQREFLPKYYPDRKVLGIIVPTIEAVAQAPGLPSRVGIICTPSTAKSHAYKKELAKLRKDVRVYEQAAARLAPLIEKNRLREAKAALEGYLKPLINKKIDTLVLGCTHYPILKREIKKIMGEKVRVISQEDIIPEKLKIYLRKHKEIDALLSKKHKRMFMVTKINQGFKEVAKLLFGKKINLSLVE